MLATVWRRDAASVAVATPQRIPGRSMGAPCRGSAARRSQRRRRKSADGSITDSAWSASSDRLIKTSCRRQVGHFARCASQASWTSSPRSPSTYSTCWRLNCRQEYEGRRGIDLRYPPPPGGFHLLPCSQHPAPGVYSTGLTISAKAARARFSRLFTVPRLQWVISAISSYERPSSSRSTNTCR